MSKLTESRPAARALDTAIVIVTYRRPAYLAQLLHSIGELSEKPGWVVVVDNASGDDTRDVAEQFRDELGPANLDYVLLAENLGGSGGFAQGIDRALALGADWVWIMDDDVIVVDEGLSKLRAFAGEYECFHGRRYDAEGKPFHWQPRFHEGLGIALPVLGDPFKSGEVFETNCGCFEGMFLGRRVIEACGLPDSRFFLTWDDTIYGWVVSQQFRVGLVDRFVLRKVRPQRQISLGIRHLNDSSDVSRYYVMRNRALVAQYLQAADRYNAILFTLGTALTLAKEMLRLFVVERKLTGLSALIRGIRDGRRLSQADEKKRSHSN